MCGISGIINLKNQKVVFSEIKSMMQAMKHRGPDDEGVFVKHNVGLGFVRLSILDLSPAGHQPMYSHNGRYIIVFNGEVFNYLEIREELTDKFNFRTGTDTEVILAAYQEWGEKCLDKLNGMFAFVIYDCQTNEIFGARDRFGIKPFYYINTNEIFAFASEIKPLLSILEGKPQANEEVIFNYLLTNRTNYSENTFFKEIKKLQHGYSFKISNNEVSFSKWYDLAENIPLKGFVSSKEYLALFEKSIRQQLQSDVPVGTCLSGGLDSSSISAILVNKLDRADMHSFSAVYEKGDIGDETEFIEEFRSTVKNLHYTTPNGPELLRELEGYIYALEEPIPGTSEYAEYKVMQLAKKHCTVILNGQGADEVLGGYDYFYGAYLKELFISLRLKQFLISVIQYWKLHGNLNGLKYFWFFMLPNSLKAKTLLNKNLPINELFYKKYLHTGLKLIKDFYSFKTLKDFFINHFHYKFEHHLLWADKSGMHFSLETRFPFLDHNLVENSLATSSNLVFRNGYTKSILRDSMEGLLTNKIRLRKDKVGYSTPEDNWFREEKFSKIINDIIESETFAKRHYFNITKVKKMAKEHFIGTQNHGQQLWKVIHLELWFRMFIDEKI